MRDSGGEFLQYRLVIEPRAARRARHVVGSVLEGWRLGGLADDVVSCVSELVANVYEHAAKSATAELLVCLGAGPLADRGSPGSGLADAAPSAGPPSWGCCPLR